MPRLISTLPRRAAILAVTAAAPFATATAVAAPGGTVVPLRSGLRTCDFSAVTNNSKAQSDGTATSVIRTTGGSVAADVHLSYPASPGTHYDVRLIQMPRKSATCNPGDPGVTSGTLDTDGGGQGSTTLQGSIQQGTTGVWLFISRPSQFSQDPAEFYVSDIIAPV